MTLVITKDRYESLGEQWISNNIKVFKDILTKSHVIKPEEECNNELEAYLHSGWRRGLRSMSDLCRYAAICFQVHGDAGEIKSLQHFIANNLNADYGVMQFLLEVLPIDYWSSLNNEMPPYACWESKK